MGLYPVIGQELPGESGRGLVQLHPDQLHRPTHGLGAGGEAGVTKAIEIIAKELDVTMALCGHRDIRNVGRDVLVPGTYPEADPAPFLRHAAAPGTT